MIFRPITFGTATPGCVVVDDGAVVVDVGGAVVVVVVVRMERTAFFCAAVGPVLHEARRHAATTAVLPSTATRRPNGTGPSCFLQRCGGAGAPARYFRMLTARATTRMATASEMAASAIIMSFIQGLTADTSVGLKAVAVAKAKWK